MGSGLEALDLSYNSAMLRQKHRLTFDRMDATEFEEFSLEVLRDVGFINLDWRKGTARSSSPADSGRDIVGYLERTDVDRTKHQEKWFIDCKHHKGGVPVRELHNLLAWAEAERPDVALFIVSGFLTNSAKDYVQNFKRNNRPPFKIKYWERPTIEELTRGKREFLQAFGLLKVNMRSEQAVIRAEREIFDRVWYYRRLVSISNAKHRGEDIRKCDVGKAPAKRLRKKYGPGISKYMSDFDWGFLQGKMSAIRWVLGDEWDFLDT